MFNSTTHKLEQISKLNKKVIDQLTALFQGDVNIYIDYANVRPWANKLGWNVDLRRLRQFLDSFTNVNSIKIYDCILKGDERSLSNAQKMKKIFRDDFRTKPVKIMRQSVNYSSITPESVALLQKFMRRCLLKHYSSQTISYLNKKFQDMNERGIYFIEDLKCNFDVEIGVDLLLDHKAGKATTFVLWSGDSDFYDPLKKLLEEGRNVILFATARRVASELNALKDEGLFIFDIQKIRDFICWKKQISPRCKKDPEGDL